MLDIIQYKLKGGKNEKVVYTNLITDSKFDEMMAKLFNLAKITIRLIFLLYPSLLKLILQAHNNISKKIFFLIFRS